MSQNLVEIVFEEIASDMLDPAIISLITSEENLINIDTYEPVVLESAKTHWRNASQLLDNKTENSACSFHIKELTIKEMVIKKPTLQVLQYEGKIDILIIVDTSLSQIFSDKNKIVKIMEWANNFLNFCQGERCYCGLEPAQDNPTRFFTDRITGPLQKL